MRRAERWVILLPCDRRPVLSTGVLVEEAITASLDGNFSSELYTGTLENGGVGLAPYNELEGEIPAELDAKIQELKQQIIDGELKVQ